MNVKLDRPGIGAAVLIWKSEKREYLLVGQGHNKKEEDMYALAGGHLESGETLIQAAEREAKEESGVGVKNIKLLTIYEFYNKAKNKQYVTVAFEAIWDGTDPIPEYDRRLSWDWYTLDEALSLPLFESDQVLLKNVKNGVLYDTNLSRNVYGFF